MKKFPPADISHLLNIVYLVILAVILLSPAILLNWKKDLHVDNRPAGKFPDLSGKRSAGIPHQFQCWFGDRFGGRKTYISLGNMLLYRIFHESPGEQIVVGSDGFIFFASHIAGIEQKNSLIRQLFNFHQRQVDNEAANFGRYLNRLWLPRKRRKHREKAGSLCL